MKDLLPGTWHPLLVSLGAMLLLAGLDFAGAIFAKEWAERHHTWLFLSGLGTFFALYVVYAKILEVAELSVVTFGWITFLQVGLLLVDRFVYDAKLPPGKWLAVALILVLQFYLVAAPNGADSSDEQLSTESPRELNQADRTSSRNEQRLRRIDDA